MIEIDEALQRVLQFARPKDAQPAPLDEALGRTLAEDVASDVDSPPHDKSMVDGYAVLHSDVASGEAELRVLEEVIAGAVPTQPLRAGYATRIMTGAPIPAGAECIVMVERTELIERGGGAEVVRIREPSAAPAQNILRRGVSIERGDIVLRAGHYLHPVEIGLLAEVGRAQVQVIGRPRAAILATGNELVGAAEVPAAGHIRNSNGPMLTALAAQAGASPVDLGIARDDEEDLRRLISQGLQADMLVLSGGVSAGVLDLVPAVLEGLGVERVFHKVRLKPGKPLWFGVLRGGERQTLVFGMPGNPVGSLVCFELFARPALAALAGNTGWSASERLAVLTRAHRQKGDRPTYWPAKQTEDGDQIQVEPLAWRGSADLRRLADANCFAFFPAGERQFAAGETVRTRLFSQFV